MDINSYEFRWSKSCRTYKSSRDILDYFLNLESTLYTAYQVINNLRSVLYSLDNLKFLNTLYFINKNEVIPGIWEIVRFYKRDKKKRLHPKQRIKSLNKIESPSETPEASSRN